MSSLQSKLEDLERRLRVLEPTSFLFCRSDGQTLFSMGEGKPHRIILTDSQVAPLLWLFEKSVEDLRGPPIMLIGENRAGQIEAATTSALILALRGQKVRICTSPGWLGYEHERIREMTPRAWHHSDDKEENHFPIGKGQIELASLGQRKPWTKRDIAVVTYYSSGSRRQVLDALASAPVSLISGEPPESKSEQWITEYRDTAHAAGRLFRFRAGSRPRLDRFMEIMGSSLKAQSDQFWGPTGL